MTPDDMILEGVAPELRKLANGSPIFLTEWGVLQHSARADVAMTDDHHLHLVEVKSEADDLRRLSGQAQVLSLAGDFCHLFAAPKHCDEALRILPPWWGVWAVARVGTVCLRPAAVNPVDLTRNRLRLLWVDELRALLKSRELKTSGAKGLLVERIAKAAAWRADLGPQPWQITPAEIFAPLRARFAALAELGHCQRKHCDCARYALRDVLEVGDCLPASVLCACGHSPAFHRNHGVRT